MKRRKLNYHERRTLHGANTKASAKNVEPGNGRRVPPKITLPVLERIREREAQRK